MTAGPPPTGARSAGVLLHPTSLAGSGVGTIGAPARRWLRRLADAGQRWWQILPLVPVDGGGSPYNGLSALAGNPLLVDPHDLATDGLLDPADAAADEPASSGPVGFPRALAWKERLAGRAHAAFRAGRASHLSSHWEAFRDREAGWLDDYALFRALRERQGGRSWTEWEPGVRDRDPAALSDARAGLADDVERVAFGQFLFDRQWRALHREAWRLGVRVLGDVPIFVAHDSADVWANRELFDLNPDGRPAAVSGVPPDYFSETGQRWGNPLYRWDRMAEDGYAWWVERFRRALGQADAVRIDHFRGFESYWEIPADEPTAVNGRWMPGPADDFFRAVRDALGGGLPLVAEDLGIITPEVEALRDRLGLPGMRVLLFAFGGGGDNPHLPENHPRNAVAYTGTHDNDTALGWWRTGATGEERGALRARVGDIADEEVPRALVRMALRSRADLAVVPVQDVLGYGGEARLNTPGTTEGNWAWRLPSGALDDDAPWAWLRRETEGAGRLPVS